MTRSVMNSTIDFFCGIHCTFITRTRKVFRVKLTSIYMLSNKNYMTTYIQDQHNVHKFWIGLYKNAISLRKNIDSLYKLHQYLTESESENYCSIFQHRHSLMRITENHEKIFLHTRADRPTFELIFEARRRFINTISCVLKQITNIESNFITSCGNDYQFTTLEKYIIYIMHSQKVILQSRIRKEQNICVSGILLQLSQNKIGSSNIEL